MTNTGYAILGAIALIIGYDYLHKRAHPKAPPLPAPSPVPAPVPVHPAATTTQYGAPPVIHDGSGWEELKDPTAPYTQASNAGLPGVHFDVKASSDWQSDYDPTGHSDTSWIG